VVSEDLQRHYLQTYGRTTDHIPNGVTPVTDADDVAVADRFGVQPGCYLLHVGRLVPEKASDVLLRAFAEVPGDDLQLVVAGGSSDTDDYVAEIFALAAHDRRVVMTGYVYGADLAALYRNARAFVLPSRLEGLPITLLEAVSHRLPLVVSAIPPHLEVVGHERPGARLAEPGSVTSLTEAIKRTLYDEDDDRRGAAALAAEVLQRYDWDAATVATEAVYRAAIDERRRSGHHAR
jgi:glycosyltransferase involved in cell wall biosynthesis